MRCLLPVVWTLAQAQTPAMPALTPPTTSPQAATPAPVALAPVQIVLDEVSLKGGKFKSKMDKASLLKALTDMFQQAGFTVLPSSGSIPPNALQMRFLVAAIHDRYDRVAFQVSGRASEGKNAKVNENLPGQPQRIWFANITAARSGIDEGVSEIHATLAAFATNFYKWTSFALNRPYANVVFPMTFPPAPEATRINPSEFHNWSSVKIKSDGYRPPWPVEALERRTAGNVLVELLVGEDGKPMRAYIKQGPPELYLHAIQWAMGYEFEPAIVDGKPVKAKFLFNMTYQQSDLERFSIR
ncbi:hypothetical protein GETHLI_34580 [Geothrix limicola]|uniref:TonB C-terminal domain-containing protein n=2 Tax=Geothrix limicola TaxID=2927978 RepID=A0ABQ5QK73_9BACT|nr:hypothetical protein GETHLI_34580 [Geothrix limicola]